MSPRKGHLSCTVRVSAYTLWLDKEVRMQESDAQEESTFLQSLFTKIYRAVRGAKIPSWMGRWGTKS